MSDSTTSLPHDSAGPKFRGRALIADPLLVGPEDAAALLGVSRDLLDSLDAQGKLPRSTRLGARKLWGFAELKNWAAVGCPDRERWERQKRTDKK